MGISVRTKWAARPPKTEQTVCGGAVPSTGRTGATDRHRCCLRCTSLRQQALRCTNVSLAFEGSIVGGTVFRTTERDTNRVPNDRLKASQLALPAGSLGTCTLCP